MRNVNIWWFSINNFRAKHTGANDPAPKCASLLILRHKDVQKFIDRFHVPVYLRRMNYWHMTANRQIVHY